MARIEKRNGRWRARVFPGGGRERSKTFDRKSDAERWAVTQEADAARGQWIDPSLSRVTFASWAKTWRSGLHRRETTLSRYDTVLRLHLLPRFGRMPLAHLSAADVQRMVAEDVAAGYSASEIRRHVIVLRQVLAAAVAERGSDATSPSTSRCPPT